MANSTITHAWTKLNLTPNFFAAHLTSFSHTGTLDGTSAQPSGPLKQWYQQEAQKHEKHGTKYATKWKGRVLH